MMKNILKISFVAFVLLSIHLNLHAQSCTAGFCPTSVTVHHKQGYISPATADITYPVFEFVAGANTYCILTRNLGATTTNTAFDQNGVAYSGWHFQWGNKQGFNPAGSYPASTLFATQASYTTNPTTWPSASDPCTQLLGSSWTVMPTGVTAYVGWNLLSTMFTSYPLWHLSLSGFILPGSYYVQSSNIWGGMWTNGVSSAAQGYAVSTGVAAGGVDYNTQMGLRGIDKSVGLPVRCVKLKTN